MEIYVHIPFCVRKCGYCDFLSFPADEDSRDMYVQRLVKQICAGIPPVGEEQTDAGAYEVVSIFLGGGTPSILTAGQVKVILDAVRRTFFVTDNAEITIECNPGTADAGKLSAFRKNGINRLSFGLQSAHDEELKRLGRIHTFEDFCSGMAAAKKAGFENINVDLMCGLPGQSRESWRDTLERVLAMEPSHISAYSLIIEEGTPFYERYHGDDVRRAEGKGGGLLPDEDTERDMYYDTRRILLRQGLEQYEISNYARPGFESLHNTGYWERRNYIGFGLGAASLLGHTRFRMTDDIRTYLDDDHVLCDIERLSPEEEMSETMFLGLRLCRGVSRAAFKASYDKTVDEVFPGITERLIRRGLLEDDGWFIRLTERGMDLSNTVMAEFLP